MTDTQVARLRLGDQIHERHTTGCVRFVCTSSAVKSGNAHHAWAASVRGGFVIRVTHNSDTHLPADCTA